MALIGSSRSLGINLKVLQYASPHPNRRVGTQRHNKGKYSRYPPRPDRNDQFS